MVNFLLSHESYLVNRFKLFFVYSRNEKKKKKKKTFAIKCKYSVHSLLVRSHYLHRNACFHKHTITPTGPYWIHFRIISSWTIVLHVQYIYNLTLYPNNVYRTTRNVLFIRRHETFEFEQRLVDVISKTWIIS